MQKLARLVSSLHATRLLNRYGFVQEQAALQRILDELVEDVIFLSFAVIFDETTTLHTSYLDNFYQEEFDPADDFATSSERPSIPRKKIRAYIDRITNKGKSSSKALDASRTVSKSYSGFVHAASPQIMDMYNGDLANFHVRGMLGTQRWAEHSADMWNCFYRGIVGFGIAAKAFGREELRESICAFADDFTKKSGKDYLSKQWGDT